MDNRDALLTQALEGSKWQNWHRSVIRADASSRRYFRLIGTSGATEILVDAPPDREDFRRFLSIAELLKNAGLCVPEAKMQNFENGVFVVSDLGKDTVAAHQAVSQESDTDILNAVLELLLQIRQIQATDLAKLDAETAINMLGPLYENYEAEAPNKMRNAMTWAFETFVSKGLVLCLRDFHGENLIWRQGKSGYDQLGLLDFQDALLAPEGYDLASYTRDARRDVPRAQQRYLEEAFAGRLGFDKQTFQLQVAVLSIQRNLRILGIFARLITAGKTKYSDYMQRVWDYIMTDLENPELSDLATVLKQNVPPPADHKWLSK